jgi:flagellin
MSLGVLNNLNAIYAENNLNSTSANLSKVLNQLSSGSKINSGADDAAGLSLVDGLQANQMALTQSQTNAAEGVGKLTVADGALSQVTNLLNRAVTLATEASNGTLNASQDTAANQEYQSILSEVSNIGSTTTYNQQQVFGSQTNIYTGDSSTVSSSVDALNIRGLSSANLGDSDGVMGYSNGSSNVFINLSSGGTNAALTDSLNSSKSTTINVNYLTKGAAGATVQATSAISVGTGTNYANTAQGLISAINNAGLGLTASFTTAANAGSAALAAAQAGNTSATSSQAAAQTGIEISASGIGTQVAGSNGDGVVGALSLAAGDTLGGTLSIVGSDGASHNITLGTTNSTENLTNLESTVNAMAIGVTASLNQAGTTLTFTSANSKVSVTGTNLTQSSAPSTANVQVTGSGLGTITLGSKNDTMSGTLTLNEGVDGKNSPTTYSLAGKTIAQVVADFGAGGSQAGLGIVASANSAGNVLSFTRANGDLGTASVTGNNIVDIAAPSVGVGSTLGSMSVANAGDSLASGTLNITSGSSVVSTLALGTGGSTDTLANLAATINGNAAYGITATLDKTGTDLTFTQTSGSGSAAVTGSGVDNTYVTVQNPVAIQQGDQLGSITLNGASDFITGGTLSLTSVDGSTTKTLAMGTGGNNETLAEIAADINGTVGANTNLSALGISATLSSDGKTLSFTGSGSAAISETPTIAGNAPVDNTPLASPTTNVVAGSGGTLGSLTVLNANEGFQGVAAAPGNVLNITEASTGTVVSLALGAVGTTDTLSNLATTINNTAAYGIKATLSSDQTSLVFTAKAGGAYTPAISSGALKENPNLGLGTTLGSLTAGNMTTSDANDTFSGTFTVQEGADGLNSPATLSFTNATLSTIAQTINNDAALGITANLNQASINNVTNNTDGGVTSPTVGGTSVAAGTVLTFTQTAGDKGTASITSNANFTQTTASGVLNAPTDLGPAVTITAGGVGAAASDSGAGGVFTAAADGTTASDLFTGTITTTNATGTFAGATLSQVAAAFNAGGVDHVAGEVVNYNVGAGTLTFTNAGADAITSDTLKSTVATSPSISVAASSDQLSGTMDVAGTTVSFQNQTLSQIMATINGGSSGIVASLNTSGGNGANTKLSFDLNGATLTSSLTDQSAGAVNGTPGILQVANAGDLLNGSLNIVSSGAGNPHSTYNITGETLEQVANSFNAVNGANHGLGITASLNNAGTALTLTAAAGASATGVGISDFTPGGTNPAQNVNETNATTYTLSAAAPGDVLSGVLNLNNAAGKGSIYSFQGQTLQEIANTFTGSGANVGTGITAAINPADNTLTFTLQAGTSMAVSGTNISDVTPGVTTNVETAPGAMQNTITVANASDTISGDLDIVGGDGVTHNDIAINTNSATGLGQTLAQIAYDFNSAQGATDTQQSLNTVGGGPALNTYGITASVSADGKTLTFSQAPGDAQPTIGQPNLGLNSPIASVTTDATSANRLVDNIGASTATQTFNTAGTGNIVNTLTAGAASDTLTGTLNIQEGADGNNTTSTYNLAGQNLAQVAAAFTTGAEKDLGIVATLNTTGTQLTFTQASGDAGKANVTDATAIDDTTLPGATAAVNVNTVSSGLGSLTTLNAGDLLTGTLTGVEGDGKTAIPSINLSTYNLTTLAAAFNTTGGSFANYGIQANLNAAGTSLTFTAKAGDAGTPSITSTTYGDSVTGGVGNVLVNHTAIPVSGGVIGSFSVGNPNDILAGTLDMTNKSNGADNIVLGTATGGAGVTTDTLAHLYATINANTSTTGISAVLSGGTSNATATTITLSDDGTGGTNNVASVGTNAATVTDYTPVTLTTPGGGTLGKGTGAIGSFSVNNVNDTLSGDLKINVAGAATTLVAGLGNLATGGPGGNAFTLATLNNFINANTVGGAATGISSALSNNGTTITFTSSGADGQLFDTTTGGATSGSTIGDVTNRVAPSTVNTITVGASNQTLSGTLTVNTGSGTVDSHNISGMTIAQIAANFNDTATATANWGSTGTNDGITASISGDTLTLAPTAGDAYATNVSSNGLTDTLPAASKNISVSGGTMLDTLSVNGKNDTLGGSLNITSGISGATTNLALGTSGSTDNLADLMATINGNAAYGITASLNQAGTQLTMAQTANDGYNAAVAPVSVTDSGATTLAASTNLGSITVASANDQLSGTLTGMQGNLSQTAFTPINLTGQTLSQLASTINVADASYGITASLNQAGTTLTFSETSGDKGTPTIANLGNVVDTTPATTTNIALSNVPTTVGANATNLGSVSILNTATLSGSVSIGSQSIAIGSGNNTAATLASAINNGNYGVTASYSTSTGNLTFTTSNSSLQVSTGSLSQTPVGTATSQSVGNLSAPTTSSAYYDIGISGNIADSSTSGGTANVGIAANTNGSNGTAVISYSDAAGVSLAQTDLTSASDAQAALTQINAAITAVAAQDGYLGAQINTLNSVSSVLSTQSENVTSAQNAVQATDYASATSNMSKYEILSQTGISALAQANSMQQEVTKLLQ